MVLRVVRILLLALLMGAPLAYGAVEPWAWATVLVAALALLFLWGFGCVREGFVRLTWSPLYMPAAAFLALGLVQYLLHQTHDLLATREMLLLLAAGLIFFFLSGQLMAKSSRRTWRRFGLVVTIYTFALALFSLLQYFSSHGLIYWTEKVAGASFGPYVNRNHYAGLLEMLIPLAAGYVLSRPANQQGRALLGFAVLVPIMSVLVCGSRGGLIALLFELLILGIVLRREIGGSQRRNPATVAVLGVTLAALLFFLIDPGHFSQRLANVARLTSAPEASLGERRAVAADALGIVRDYPVLGTGLGSFRVVYPRYQSFPDNKTWDHAHNDYVEILSETGLAGGLLMLAALLLFFRLVFRRLHERLRTEIGWVQFGSALGAWGMLVHSLFDFNLHIWANAIWFAVCVALATSPVRRELEPVSRRI